jgi:hypothetical protein
MNTKPAAKDSPNSPSGKPIWAVSVTLKKPMLEKPGTNIINALSQCNGGTKAEALAAAKADALATYPGHRFLMALVLQIKPAA